MNLPYQQLSEEEVVDLATLAYPHGPAYQQLSGEEIQDLAVLADPHEPALPAAV